ncbi:MAG: hypothetical protein HYX52_07160 [Chloroflexi bacterium]|nr:hypothetical protein [Chloroflexota bacterium]
MKTAEREQAYLTLIGVMQEAIRLGDQGGPLFEHARSLATLVGDVPQALVARTSGRSRPTIGHLVTSGAIPQGATGRIPALNAALVAVALQDSGRARNIRRRVVQATDWLHELRDPAFTEGLDQFVAATALEPIDPSLSPAEEDAAIEALLSAQLDGRDGPPAKHRSAVRPAHRPRTPAATSE